MSLPNRELQPGNREPLVYCVLVNWNGWLDTIACVTSLRQQDYRSLCVLVVDNNSNDDSVDHLSDLCSPKEILKATSNDGFAAGCNLGIRAALMAGADFVWLLNNDTTAPPNTLSLLLEAAKQQQDKPFETPRHPLPGIVGTVLRFMHKPSNVQAWGGGTVKRWLGYATHFYKPTPLQTDSFLTFASVLIRREVFDEIGLLDERFFMYFEDADFCFRARNAGWQLVVAPDTAVLHKEGGSTSRDDSSGRQAPFKQRVSTASGLHFLRLHGRPKSLSIVLFLLLRIVKRILTGDPAGLRAVMQGVSDQRNKRVFDRAASQYERQR